MTTQDLELKRKNITKVIAVVGVCAIAFPLAGIIFTVIQGLVGMIVAGIIGYGAIMFMPVFGRMVANWRLKALKAEAARNPIETLQNEEIKKQDALAKYRDQLNEFGAQLLSFADQVKQYQRDGLEDAPVYVEQLRKMKQLQDVRQQKYTEACQMLADFHETISRTQRKWEMACAAAKMSEAAGEIDGNMFDRICTETAMDSVQTKLNKSFAELDMVLLDEKSKPHAPTRQLAEPVPDDTFTVTAESIPVKAKH